MLRIYLSIYYLFYFSLLGVYVIYLPKTLEDLNFSNIEIGIIVAAAPLMRFILPFIFKYFIKLDKQIYLLSLIFTFISSIILYMTVQNFYLYLLSNLLFGAALGVSLPFIETIALHIFSKNIYGKIRLSGSIGFLLIALILGNVLYSPFYTFYYLISMAFLTLISGYFIYNNSGFFKEEEKYQTNSKHSDRNFSLRLHWSFWLSIFLTQVSFGGFYTFFTIYESAKISLTIVSFMWGVGVLAEILMLYFQGPLLKRNLLTIIKIATFVTVIRWLLLYIDDVSMYITLLSQSLHAISFALYHTAGIIYILSLYPQKNLAQQFFLGIGFGLGGFVGSILAGFIYGEYLFLFESIIALFAFIILFF